MPQLLYFTDIRSTSYRKVMEKFPQGPMFEDESEENDGFEETFDVEDDTSGESIEWFVIGFLVRWTVLQVQFH